ncbi:hypothetical protein [Haloplanus halophilus]|uniref:hypothetical protein n=1 Tax=Haloplanus halophilus TaxID=2949993 RepID=UPI00203EC2F2|nr:hypothetical protein [Haloplanus sp. GDY1]
MSEPTPITSTAAAVTPLQSGATGPVPVPATAPVRAAAACVLVLAVGAALRYRWPDALDRAVDATLERPVRSPIYGVATAVLGWLVVAYAFGQAGRLGAVAGRAAAVVGTGGALVVAAAGVVVVGTTAATVVGEDAWTGPLVGASVSGLVWLALPAAAALGVWLLVAAVGIGGAARRWIHASRSVEARVEG